MNNFKQIVLVISVVWSFQSSGQINLNKYKENVPQKKTETGTSGNSTSVNANSTNLADYAKYYDEKRKFIYSNLANAANREWDENFMNLLETLDWTSLEQKIATDINSIGDHLMIYPKKLPTSGMGTMTQQNLGDYKIARVAEATAEPPATEHSKLILDFYKQYVMFKQGLINGSENIAKMIQTNIQKTESEFPVNKFNSATYTKRQALLAYEFLPDNMRISDLKDDAVKMYDTVLDGFGNLISGSFHRQHMMEIVVFGSEPTFGQETESALLQKIIPGKAAYVTGYFGMTNKVAGGIPSLLFISPSDAYAKDKNPWGHGTEVIASMFDGKAEKETYYEKAYYTFNLFPDINTINYESHVSYFPHLNIIKWLMYLPSEELEIPVRYGRKEKVALGKITIDLSGDNKQKLKDYYDQLLQKQLAAVTYPNLAGCEDAKSKIINYADLAQYGEVLRITLQSSGDIMKPWPNENEVDFNTAEGYAAVKKSSGKIEIMALEFRKRPTETQWQWWSVGMMPGLYPMDDNGTQITGVKKLEHGYEILPENVSKCGYWFTAQ